MNISILKRLATVALASVACAMAVPAQDIEGEMFREHRGIYMTPFLSSNWPSSAITTVNAQTHKNNLTRRLDKFKDQNVNVLYYHVRSMCDANYDSKYEPWSSTVSGQRGKAPAFDPFGFLVEEAHNRGIEVYAWVNPYRYCNGSGYGEGCPEDYENSHPDWLLKSTSQTILNPALPEVQQRICDVVADILEKYDVDGIIFDDYFYSSPSPTSIDKSYFDAYRAAGGKETNQLQWRRDNVNTMVRRVGETIKALKPHVVFAISPAGVAAHGDLKSKYGVEPPAQGGDWQYDGIASDPVNWLYNQYIDVLMPQIYWPSRYEALNSWWNDVAQKFNRHMYAAVDLSDVATYSTTEFIREANLVRNTMPADRCGTAYFQYQQYVNHNENIFGTRQDFGSNMRDGIYKTKALTPIRSWLMNKYNSCAVTGLTLDGSTLKWTAPREGLRYVVYCIPENFDLNDFVCQRSLIEGITYTNSYEIPADKLQNTRWIVSAYDRFGFEYAPTVAGTAPGSGKSVAKLVSPSNNGHAVDLFDFEWEGKGARFMIELADDANFTNVIGVGESSTTHLAGSALPALQDGKTYYWRVHTYALNSEETVSASAAFTASRLSVLSPADGTTNVSLTPTLTWDKCGEGTSYDVVVATDAACTRDVFKTTLSTNSVSIPAKVLNTGRKYYVKVTATRNGRSSETPVATFVTANRADYSVPVITNPAANGATLHCNESVTVADYDGMATVEVYISASNTFPARTSYKATLSNYETASAAMESIKVSSKALVDGETYFVRVRGGYYLDGNATVKYTDYSAPVSFVYSAEAGVGDVVADAPDMPAQYYDLQGRSIDADAMTPGIYIRRQGAKSTKVVVK